MEYYFDMLVLPEKARSTAEAPENPDNIRITTLTKSDFLTTFVDIYADLYEIRPLDICQTSVRPPQISVCLTSRYLYRI